MHILLKFFPFINNTNKTDKYQRTNLKSLEILKQEATKIFGIIIKHFSYLELIIKVKNAKIL
jgi:hypothetical protein